MKKLITIFIVLLFAVSAQAWTLNWNDTTGEDGYIVSYKPYPATYSFPGNPAPANLITDTAGATQVNLGADVTEWDIPELTADQRYVFFIQATEQGSVSALSDFVCWTYPSEDTVIELPLETQGDIQINIYQAPR